MIHGACRGCIADFLRVVGELKWVVPKGVCSSIERHAGMPGPNTTKNQATNWGWVLQNTVY